MLILALCLPATNGIAQDTKDKSLVERNLKNADKFDLDLSAPTAPGLVMIGVSPKDAADPGNFKDFAVDAASFVDGDTLKPGLAFSGTPFWWNWNDDPDAVLFTLDDYQDSNSTTYLHRLAARTQISLGTAQTKGQATDKSIKVGFGFSTQLLDSQDQRLSDHSYNCIQDVWIRDVEPQFYRVEALANQKARQQLGLPSVGRPPFDLEAKFIELQDKLRQEELQKLKLSSFSVEKKRCLEAAAQRFLASPSWVVGGGLAALSDSGELEDIDYSGASIWSTFRYPFTQDGSGALTFFVRGDLDREFSLKSAGTGEANAILAAVSGVYETDTLKIDGTVSYTYKDYDNPALGVDDFVRISGTIGYKIREGVWIEGSAGAVSNAKFEEEGFGLLNLKLDFGD